MKKLLILVVAVSLLISTGAYARSPVSGGVNYKANADYISAYNASGVAMTSGTIVIIASTGAGATGYTTTQVATGSTLGAYITTTAVADDARAIGVVDDDSIAIGGVGRIIVGGPARVRLSSGAGVIPGQVISTSGTAGMAKAASTTSGILGVAIDNAEAADADNNGLGVWIWIYPR